MKTILSLCFLSTFFTTSAFAEKCHYSYDSKETKIGFEAFKTPKKVGVKVGFDKFAITPKKNKASDIMDLIKNSSLSIDIAGINSGNPARDEKLKTIFFSNEGKPVVIEGKVLSVKNELVNLELKLNGVKKVVPMKYSVNDSLFEASAVIDVLEFGLQGNLSALNKACFDLHEGKTWSDVTIKIESKFLKTCK